MLAKVTSGSGLRGSLAYDLSLAKNGEPRGTWVAGSLIGSPREMARQAGAFRSLRPDCRKAILRVSLSANPADGFLSEKKWAEIAADFLEEMGIDPSQHAWCAIRHKDLNKIGQPHDHIHLSVVRVSGSGQLWNQEFSAKRAIKASEFLEQKHDLETHAREPPDRRRPQKNEQEIKNRKGNIEMPREKITAAIDLVLSQNPGGVEFEDFKDQLEKRGVNLRASTTQSGRLQGFSFEADQVAFPGSKLGSDYGLSGLLQRGVQPPVTAQAKPASADTPAAAEAPRERVAQPTNQAKLQPQQRAPTKSDKEDDDEERQTGFLLPAPMSTADRERRQQEHEQRQRAIQNRADSSNFAKALSQLGAAISHFAIEVIARIIEWLKAFLSRFGLGARQQIVQSAGGQRLVSLQPEVIEVEAKLIEPTPKPLMLDYRLAQGAAAIEQVSKALVEKNFENLPGTGSTGRDELIAALQEAVKPDEAAVFSGVVASQLKHLVAALVENRKAEAEFEKTYTDHDSEGYQLGVDLENAKNDAERLKRLDDAWAQEHWARHKIGHTSPQRAQMETAAANLLKLQAQFVLEKKKRTAKWEPILAVADKRIADSKTWVQSASSELHRAGQQVASFYADPRFGELSVMLSKHLQAVTAGANSRLMSRQHIDLQTPVSDLSKTLQDWGEAAKTPSPRAHKPLLRPIDDDAPDHNFVDVPRG